MANHKSAAKKARRDEEARLRNRSNRSAVKTAVKKFLAVVSTGSKTEAFIKAAKMPVHVPLSGKTMEFDAAAKCTSGC